MAFTKDWRPADWALIKENIVKETGIVFSPSAGYSREDKDKFMEAAASAVLGQLAAVMVPPVSSEG